MIENQIKTVALLGTLTALLLYVGKLLGGPGGLVIAAFFVIIMNFVSYWFSDKIVLKMYKAKKIEEADNPTLYKMVREVSQLAKIPMPAVYVMPSHNSNAFATGRNPKHSAVAVTKGIMDILSHDELKGVIAHEISHIKNRDTLIQTVTGMIAGIISYVATMARWGAMFGGFGGRDGDDNIVEFLVLALVTPLIATIIQLAISRSREFMADESAAKILHKSSGLAGALRKISSDNVNHPMRMGNNSTAHLFISNPFKGSGIFNLLSTHPPIEKRIEKLNGLRLS